MKRHPLSTARLRAPLSAALAALLAAPAAFAATYFWDIDGATAGAGGATPLGAWTVGGTTWSTSSNGTVATAATTTLPADDLVFSAGVNATGAYTASLTSAQDAGSLLFQEGTATISGAGGIIRLGSAGGKITVNNGAAALIGAATDTLIGGSTGITKAGVGTLTLNGTAAHPFSGGLNVNGGTLALNFANMAAPADMIGSGNPLSLGGGRLLVTGNAAGTTSQTFGNVTVNSGGGRILGDKNGGTATNISLGTLTTTASGGSLLAGAGGTAANSPVISTTSGALTNGIYSGRAVFFDGTANTGYDWLTNGGGAGPAYTLSGLAAGSYTALDLAAGTDTNNSTISATAAVTGDRTTNSLKFAAPATAQTVTIDTGLTLTSGGLIFTGAAVAVGPRIAGGTITAGNGSGSYDLVVHQFNATLPTILGSGAVPGNASAINASITDNGANPVTLVKNGQGVLYLGGANTFTGGIIVNEGGLYAGVLGALNNNNITFNANAVFSTVNVSGNSTTGSITLNNNSQVTLVNNNFSFTIEGAVTGTGGLSIEKGGLGSVTINLNSTDNTFTGPILFPHRQQNQQAHVNINSLADTAAVGEGNIIFSTPPSHTVGLSVSHNFNYGAGAIAPLILNNRRFELAGTQISHQINNNSSHPFSINTDLLVSSATGKNLTLGGTGSGISTFAGRIANHPAPVTGSTILGQNGSVYGANRTDLMLASVEGIAIGDAISAATGIPAGTTIADINPLTRVVTLSAGLTANPGIGSSITVASVVNSVSVTKAGTGTWVLTGANTYTGATNIAASGGGILQLGDGGTGGSLSPASRISIGAGSTFMVNQSDTVTQGTDFSSAPISGEGEFIQAGSGQTVLNQANTWTGPTRVAGGTLTFAGGSVTSPITVQSGASLGFTLAASTTSTSPVIFETGSTVRITSTPTLSSYTLMTASALEGIPPVLDTAIPGYQLVVTGGNTLLLNSTGGATPYSTWAGGAGFGADANGDGLANGIAWMLGATGPEAASESVRPVPQADSGMLTVSFKRVSDRGAAKLSLQYGTTTAAWTTVEIPAASGTIAGGIAVSVSPGSPTEKITVQIPVALAAPGSRLFARLLATEN